MADTQHRPVPQIRDLIRDENRTVTEIVRFDEEMGTQLRSGEWVCISDYEKDTFGIWTPIKTRQELVFRRKWAQRIREEFDQYHEHTQGSHVCAACGSIQAANWMDPDFTQDGPAREVKQPG